MTLARNTIARSVDVSRRTGSRIVRLFSSRARACVSQASHNCTRWARCLFDLGLIKCVSVSHTICETPVAARVRVNRFEIVVGKPIKTKYISDRYCRSARRFPEANDNERGVLAPQQTRLNVFQARLQ